MIYLLGALIIVLPIVITVGFAAWLYERDHPALAATVILVFVVTSIAVRLWADDDPGHYECHHTENVTICQVVH